jgi:hypothetical protein
MNIINKYRQSGNLVLHLPFYKKTLLDDSGYSHNVASIYNGAVWKKANKRTGAAFASNGYAVVADTVNLRTTSCFIWWFGSLDTFANGGSNIRLLSKRDAGGSDFDFYVSSAGAMAFHTGSSSSTLSTTTLNKKFFAVRQSASGYPEFFVDGLYIGLGATSLTKNADDAPLSIGNYSPSPTVGNINPTFDCGIINTSAITNQEIAQLYEDLMAEQSAGDPKPRNYKGFMPPIEASCLLAYDMATRTTDGKLADLSGNGKNITYTQGSLARTRSGYPSVSLVAASTATFTATSLGTTHTLELIADDWNVDSMLLLNPADPSNVFACFYDTATIYYTNDARTFVPWVVGSMTTGEHHIVIDRNGTSVTLYLDGVNMTTKTLGNNTILTVGALAAAGYPFTGKRGYMQVYSTSKGATWASNRYKQYAEKIIYNPQPEYYLPTLANVSAGALSNTGFEAVSGSFKVSEDSSKKKWIECVTAGLGYVQQTNAYGTFVLEFQIDTLADEMYLTFIADAKESRDGANQDGYYMVVAGDGRVGVGETVSGSLTSKGLSAAGYVALNTPYKYAISRSLAGIFYQYIKGGIYTNWTLVSAVGGLGSNPFTDTTTTSSKYLTAYLAAGNKFRLLGIHQGLLTTPELSAIYK